MKTGDPWKEVWRRLGMENSSMNANDVFAGDRFRLFINLISMKDNDLHGSGLRSNEIHRNGSGSGNVKCHIIFSDTQVEIVYRELVRVTNGPLTGGRWYWNENISISTNFFQRKLSYMRNNLWRIHALPHLSGNRKLVHLCPQLISWCWKPSVAILDLLLFSEHLLTHILRGVSSLLFKANRPSIIGWNLHVNCDLFYGINRLFPVNLVTSGLKAETTSEASWPLQRISLMKMRSSSLDCIGRRRSFYPNFDWISQRFLDPCERSHFLFCSSHHAFPFLTWRHPWMYAQDRPKEPSAMSMVLTHKLCQKLSKF